MVKGPFYFVFLSLALIQVVQSEEGSLVWTKEATDIEKAVILNCVRASKVLEDVAKSETEGRRSHEFETQAEALAGSPKRLVIFTYLDRFCFFVSLLQGQDSWKLTRLGVVKGYAYGDKEDAVKATKEEAHLYYFRNPYAFQEDWVTGLSTPAGQACKKNLVEPNRVWTLQDGIHLVGLYHFQEQGDSKFAVFSYADSAKETVEKKHVGSLHKHQWEVEEELERYLLSIYLTQPISWLQAEAFEVKFGKDVLKGLVDLGKTATEDRLVLPGFTLETVLPVSNNGFKCFAIFGRGGDDEKVLLGADKAFTDSSVVVTHLSRGKLSELMKSVKNCYELAFVKEVGDMHFKERWGWPCERASDPTNIAYQLDSVKTLQNISVAAPFDIPNGEMITLEKLRLVDTKNVTMVGFYRVMGKVFMGAFGAHSELHDRLILKHISALGTVKDLVRSYNGCMTLKTAFQENMFKNSLGVLSDIPSDIRSNLPAIYQDMVNNKVALCEEWLHKTGHGYVPPPPYYTDAKVTWFALLCRKPSPNQGKKLQYFYSIAVFYDSVFQCTFSKSYASQISVDKAREYMQTTSVRPMHREVMENSKPGWDL